MHKLSKEKKVSEKLFWPEDKRGQRARWQRHGSSQQVSTSYDYPCVYIPRLTLLCSLTYAASILFKQYAVDSLLLAVYSLSLLSLYIKSLYTFRYSARAGAICILLSCPYYCWASFEQIIIFVYARGKSSRPYLFVLIIKIMHRSTWL